MKKELIFSLVFLMTSIILARIIYVNISENEIDSLSYSDVKHCLRKHPQMETLVSEAFKSHNNINVYEYKDISLKCNQLDSLDQDKKINNYNLEDNGPQQKEILKSFK